MGREHQHVHHNIEIPYTSNIFVNIFHIGLSTATACERVRLWEVSDKKQGRRALTPSRRKWGTMCPISTFARMGSCQLSIIMSVKLS